MRSINYLCEHTNTISQKIPTENLQNDEDYQVLQLADDAAHYDKNVNYYDRFWKLFLMNENTAWKVNQLYDNIEQILSATQ